MRAARATDPQPGILARWSGECYRCGEPVIRNVSRVGFKRGNPVHVECMSGFDDDK